MAGEKDSLGGESARLRVPAFDLDNRELLNPTFGQDNERQRRRQPRAVIWGGTLPNAFRYHSKPSELRESEAGWTDTCPVLSLQAKDREHQKSHPINARQLQ